MKNLVKKGFWGLIVVIFFSVTLVGCSSGLSKAELEKQVAKSIEDYLNNGKGDAFGKKVANLSWNPFSVFKVQNITLVKRGENEYKGSAIIDCTGSAKTVTATQSLSVIADKDSFQWEFE